MSVLGKTLAFAACLGALAAPVAGQQRNPCTERAKMTELLNGKYQESQTGAGMQSTSRVVEIWSSHDGSWTIVATDARGVSCILASGTHWRHFDPPVVQEGVAG